MSDPTDSKQDQKALKKAAKYSYLQNRELSWLDFNVRVLDQSRDASVPLLERLTFVSIFAQNLQEFFMIRVGALTDLALVKREIRDSKSGMTPAEQLAAIYHKCHQIMPYYDKCYKRVSDELAEVGIVNCGKRELTAEQENFIDEFFDLNVMPFLSPQIVNSRHPFPHLENGALYVIVRLNEMHDEQLGYVDSHLAIEEKQGKNGKASKEKRKGKGKNKGAEGVTIGIIPMPAQCDRIVRLPGSGFQFMLLEHLIERFVERVFYMYKVKHTNIVSVTRNADLDAIEGEDEHGSDYRDHIKRILKKRMRLMPVRLESERPLSDTVHNLLLDRLGLKDYQAFVCGSPLSMSYVSKLSAALDEDTRAQLTFDSFSPQWPHDLDRHRSMIEQIEEHDILVSYPYETMETFVELLREAAMDPDVISIKITLYRLAPQSQIAQALIAAAEAGKEVTALFELRARFDESNNIEWSQRFEEAGCHVVYGFRDYKVHTKICCITRRKAGKIEYITQMGTGNYNEKTAKLYTDFSFMTANEKIGRDAAEFFRNMTLENLSDEYTELWVAPLQIKQNIIAMIDEQIERKKAGLPAGLFFKTNSITDKKIINKIVEASQAGVPSMLLVRGISCIVPGIPGYTDNVCVVSIVGRLLEHSRIYLFGPFDGDFKVYLSSADLMTRNMNKRIELAWPVNDPRLQNKLLSYIATCLADTAKLRDLLPNKHYTDLGYFAREGTSPGEVMLFDSQNYLINQAYDPISAKSENVLELDSENISEVEEQPVDILAIQPENDLQSSESVFEQPATDAPVFEQPATGASGLPLIDGLYTPELNPDGKFTIPDMNGGEVEIDRFGGPVIDAAIDDSQ